MATLLSESRLNAALEDIIRGAESYILFMCPYFKLHDRLRDCLKLQKSNPEIKLIVIFGKNDEDPSKSLNKDDLEFLKSFPNVCICYEKRLHAKYYANEKFGLITSINLHSFSMNNNIEVGVWFKQKEGVGFEADSFFDDVLENAEMIFERVPKYESKVFGLKKSYIESETIIDNSNGNFKNLGNRMANGVHNNRVGTIKNRTVEDLNKDGYQHNKNYYQNNGFCIRTKKSIPFDSYKPMALDSFRVWAEYSNQDFIENYCHKCGKSAKTSMRSPLCKSCKDKICRM